MGKITVQTLATAIADDTLFTGVLTPGSSPLSRRFTAVTAALYFAVSASNTQTGNYTLVLGDAGKTIVVNAATGKTLTFPPNSSVAYPVGTVIGFEQYGAGVITLTPGSGVTIRSYNGLLATAGQYAAGTARKIGTDEWLAAGALA